MCPCGCGRTVKPGNTYATLTCRSQATKRPKPACLHCGQPCARVGMKHCSLECSHVSQRRTELLPRCAAEGCPNRVKRKGKTYCSVACAHASVNWVAASRRALEKTTQARRAQSLQGLQERLEKFTKKSQIYRYAYELGYRAAYKSLQRKVERGDITINRARAVRGWL